MSGAGLKPGDVVRLRSGGRRMVVIERKDIKADGSLATLILLWHDKRGRPFTAQDVPEDCVERCSR